MQGLTQYITDEIWADILRVSFVYIDDAYGRLAAGQQPQRRAGVVWEALFSDSEVITITLFGQYLRQFGFRVKRRSSVGEDISDIDCPMSLIPIFGLRKTRSGG